MGKGKSAQAGKSAFGSNVTANVRPMQLLEMVLPRYPRATINQWLWNPVSLTDWPQERAEDSFRVKTSSEPEKENFSLA
jgi:hypothetical protein